MIRITGMRKYSFLSSIETFFKKKDNSIVEIVLSIEKEEITYIRDIKKILERIADHAAYKSMTFAVVLENIEESFFLTCSELEISTGFLLYDSRGKKIPRGDVSAHKQLIPDTVSMNIIDVITEESGRKINVESEDRFENTAPLFSGNWSEFKAYLQKSQNR